MMFIYKFCLSLMGLMGLASSISIPLVMNSGGQANLSVDKGFEKVGASTNATSVVDIEKCKDSTGETINFGNQRAGKICWTLGTAEDKSIEISEDSKYTDLFTKMGHQKEKSGEAATNYGKRICEKGGNKGMFTVQVGGKEFLGLCDNDAQSLKQGIVVENKNRDNLEIRLCSGECFGSKNAVGGQQIDPKEERNLGNKVVFKNRN